MSPDLFLALVSYAFVTSITPGPGNFTLLASGVNFGLTRSVPLMLGLCVGFFGVLIATGLGLGALLTAMPALHAALKIAGAAYLLYLAWRIAMTRALSQGGLETAQPLAFLQAAAFPWTNPKAWIMAISAMAVYANPTQPIISAMLVAAIFAVVNFPCMAIWAGSGAALRHWLSDPHRLKGFNIAMGVLLALSLLPLLR